MAWENSRSIPDVNRFAASLTSVAVCVIIPGRTRPTVIVSRATTTKMSSSAAISALCPSVTLLTAMR